MRLSILTTTLASLSATSARIIGLSAPSTIAPNSTFTLTLLTENYIQTVADIAVAYGFQLPTSDKPTGFPYTLGAFTGSAYLGPDKSNTIKEVAVQARADEGLAGDSWKGRDVVLSAGVYSLYGASGGATVVGFNVTVRIGEKTSVEVVKSQGSGWVENGS